MTARSKPRGVSTPPSVPALVSAPRVVTIRKQIVVDLLRRLGVDGVTPLLLAASDPQGLPVTNPPASEAPSVEARSHSPSAARLPRWP